MDADHFFKSAAWLLVGICFTLVVISIMDRKSNLRAFNEAHNQLTGNATALVPSASDTPALFGNQSAPAVVHCSPVSYMPTLRTAVDLGRILGQLDMKAGAELGAKDGNFTKLTLSHWKTAELYVLVDEWPVLYGVNHTHFHDNHIKEKALAAVKEMVSAQKLKEYQICHNKTTVCAGRFADDSFDFVYLNAHHDDKVSTPSRCPLHCHCHCTNTIL